MNSLRGVLYFIKGYVSSSTNSMCQTNVHWAIHSDDQLKHASQQPQQADTIFSGSCLAATAKSITRYIILDLVKALL